MQSNMQSEAEPQWQSVVIVLRSDAPEDTVDWLAAELMEFDVAGLEVRDTAEQTEVVASFAAAEGRANLAAVLMEHLSSSGLPVAATRDEAVPDVDWAEHWKRHFRPLDFGALWIVPSWMEAPPEAQAVLQVDPSRAFGTGLHATTALCLERVVELNPNCEVLDVGTGTGILAMAALLMGAPRALGTDNDPDALEVAAENAEANGLSDRLQLSGTDVAELSGRYELVIANILAGPLEQMAPGLARRVAPGGRLLLSGILFSQAESVEQAYAAQGLDVQPHARRDEWVRLELLRPAD